MEESSEEDIEEGGEDISPLPNKKLSIITRRKKKGPLEEGNSRRLGQFLTPENFDSLY